MTTEHVPNDAHLVRLVLLQADIDDETAERLAAFAESAMEGGALDCMLLPVMMKKGRPGTRVEILVPPERAQEFTARLLRETTTLGVRRITVERTSLARRMELIDVDGHRIRVKVALWNGRAIRAKAEFEDCRQVAAATGRVLADVCREAERRSADAFLSDHKDDE